MKIGVVPRGTVKVIFVLSSNVSRGTLVKDVII
jgi:hypothetical protein